MLPVDHEIQFPIYDRTGVLLLAEGSVVTRDFKTRLREREIVTVNVHHQDARTMIRRRDDAHTNDREAVEAAESVEPDAVDREFENEIAEIAYVTNAGPAFREDLRIHRCDGYSAELRAQLKTERTKSIDEISDLMSRILKDRSLSGESVMTTTGRYLEQMQADMSCVLASEFASEEGESIANHCLKMAVLAMSIATEMGLNKENVRRIGVTGLLHDWGMLKIPVDVRDPKRPPKTAELLEIQKHPIYSLDLLEKVQGLPSLVPMLSYQVHERLDGSGYPRRRQGQSIHLFSRILNVAHEFTALTNPTRYRPAFAPYHAMLLLLNPPKQRCHDPLIVRALLRTVSLFPIGSSVVLEDGREAKVIRGNPEHYTQPIVEIETAQEAHAVESDADAEKNKGSVEIVDLHADRLSVKRVIVQSHERTWLRGPHFLRRDPFATAMVKRQRIAKSQAASRNSIRPRLKSRILKPHS